MDLGLRGSVAVVTRGCVGIRLAIGEARPVDGMVALQDFARTAAFLASSGNDDVAPRRSTSTAPIG